MAELGRDVLHLLRTSLCTSAYTVVVQNNFCLCLLMDLPLICTHSGLGFLCLVKTCTILSAIQGENGTARRMKHHYPVML